MMYNGRCPPASYRMSRDPGLKEVAEDDVAVVLVLAAAESAQAAQASGGGSGRAGRGGGLAFGCCVGGGRSAGIPGPLAAQAVVGVPHSNSSSKG